jgi:flagellar basal-body rod protein FlgF
MAMNNAAGIGLTGLMALERRLETLAHNVANMNTVGFRADVLRFSTEIERAGGAALAFAAIGGEHVSSREGARIETGNPMDVALRGDGWLSLQGPNGAVFTRDGRMEITVDGQLVNVTGLPVLDPGGSEITLDPRGGAIEIGVDGTIRQNGRAAGIIGMFALSDLTAMSRVGDVAFSYAGFAEPVTEFRMTGLMQGRLEQANVSPVEQMAAMVTVSRQFEAVANALRSNEESHSSAIRTLGGSNN